MNHKLIIIKGKKTRVLSKEPTNHKLLSKERKPGYYQRNQRTINYQRNQANQRIIYISKRNQANLSLYYQRNHKSSEEPIKGTKKTRMDIIKGTKRTRMDIIKGTKRTLILSKKLSELEYYQRNQ